MRQMLVCDAREQTRGSSGDIIPAAFRGGVVLCSQKEEDVMSTSKKPLKPDDFPVNAEGKKIKKQDGTPIANTEDPAVAADVAERLNDDEARREDDKWSA